MTEATSKKFRQGRANARQINALIDYLEENQHVATGKFNSLHGKIDTDRSWETLCEHLNTLATDGKSKSVQSWKNTWRDHKSKVSEKVQKLRHGKAQTGNKPVNVSLTEVDKRILAIIGYDYVEGIGTTADSFPEDHENGMEELFNGNDHILDDIPININSNVEQSMLDDSQISSNRNYEFESFDGDVPSTSAEAFIAEKVRSVTTPLRKNKQSLDQPSTNDLEIADLEENSATVPKRIRRERLGVQFSDARDSFQKIQETQANALMMMATSMQTQADGTKMLAEAIQKLSAIQEKQTEMFRLLQ